MSCIKERRPLRAQVTRSDDWAWALWEGFLQSVLPPGLSHRSRGTPAGLGVFPSDCPGARTRQAAPSGPRGRGQGSRSQSAARGGPARGPLPPQSLLCSFPRSWGRREEDLDGVQILHFLLKLPGKTLEAAEGRPAGRGVDGRTRGGAGEAPLAVRIRHRDRRTRGTILSLQGPHGGDTANTLLNNPARALLQTP